MKAYELYYSIRKPLKNRDIKKYSKIKKILGTYQEEMKIVNTIFAALNRQQKGYQVSMVEIKSLENSLTQINPVDSIFCKILEASIASKLRGDREMAEKIY